MRTAFAVGDFIRRCGDNFPKGEGREHSPPSLPLWGRWLSEARSDEVGPAAREVKYGNVQPEGVKGGDRKAPLSPPQRRNPLLSGKSSYGRKTSYSVAPIWRDNVE